MVSYATENVQTIETISTSRFLIFQVTNSARIGIMKAADVKMRGWSIRQCPSREGKLCRNWRLKDRQG